MQTHIETRAKVKMPKIIYGTAWKKERTAQLVEKALENGFLGIDTACQPRHYNEALVGEAVASAIKGGMKRSNIFLQTKFTSIGGQDPDNIPYDPKASLKEQVEQSFACSLRNLQTDYLDSWVLHGPLDSYEETREVWQAMEGIAASGGVKQLGVSNFYQTDYFQKFIEEATIKPAVLQNRFYRETDYDKTIRDLCHEHEIIYQSFWTLTANPHILASSELTSISLELDKTAPQILFRYLSQKGIVPLTGTSDQAHMKEDLKIFDFELSKAQETLMDSLF